MSRGRAERAAAALNELENVFGEEDRAGLCEVAIDYFTNTLEDYEREKEDWRDSDEEEIDTGIDTIYDTGNYNKKE